MQLNVIITFFINFDFSSFSVFCSVLLCQTTTFAYGANLAEIEPLPSLASFHDTSLCSSHSCTRTSTLLTCVLNRDCCQTRLGALAAEIVEACQLKLLRSKRINLPLVGLAGNC